MDGLSLLLQMYVAERVSEEISLEAGMTRFSITWFHPAAAARHGHADEPYFVLWRVNEETRERWCDYDGVLALIRDVDAT